MHKAPFRHPRAGKPAVFVDEAAIDLVAFSDEDLLAPVTTAPPVQPRVEPPVRPRVDREAASRKAAAAWCREQLRARQERADAEWRALQAAFDLPTGGPA